MQILQASRSFGVAAIRFGLAAIAIAIGALVIVLLALLPVKRNGVRLPLIAASTLSRLFLAIFGVRVLCESPDKFHQHRGLIFCNHLSYLDIMVLLSVAPVRFLSARGVQRIPFVGWIATAIDTLFVNRGDQNSRAAARQTLAAELRTRAYPPLVLFPEGGIGPGDRVLPFRRGAFEVAAAESIAYLLCVLHYEPLSIATYYAAQDTLPKAVWRLATHRGSLHVRLMALQIETIGAGSSPEFAAEQAHQRLQRVYAEQLRR